jgi:DNA-binding protein HU-beta
MNKKNLINKVAQKTGYSQTHIEKILWPIFESITEALCEKEKITISNFGTFQVKDMPERKSRNPSTGQPIVVKAKEVVKFKPCPNLLNKDKVV